MQLSSEQQQAIDEQKQYCPFCKIIKGEIPSQKVFEDKDFIAVLDINPGVPGHTLLVPKEHYPILPLMPQEQQRALGSLIAQLSSALKKAMLVNNTEAFIANGASAGQQSSHFLVHIIPSENPLFTLTPGESEQASKLEGALKQRFGTAKPQEQKDELTKAIAEQPELRRMIAEQPEELIKNLHAAPELEKLFRGVDIMKLSMKLREAGEKTASLMSDTELIAYINSKERLREMLVQDPATLEEASQQQPKLKAFFQGTSVAAVRARYLGDDNV